MILNPEKFQSMTLQKSGSTETYRLQIDGKLIETTSSVKLLGINISNKLTFDDHISYLCSKASVQLNAISRLRRFFEKIKKIEVIGNNFVNSRL